MAEKLAHEAQACDDGKPWGWINNGAWRSIPKVPLLMALKGPPPFDVKLPDGQIRHIVHNPNNL